MFIRTNGYVSFALWKQLTYLWKREVSFSHQLRRTGYWQYIRNLPHHHCSRHEWSEHHYEPSIFVVKRHPFWSSESRGSVCQH